MSAVVVVAVLKVKPGSEEEAVAGLTPAIEQTHAEAGCLAYALHRDVGDPQTFVLVERWTSQVALENHFRQSYVAALGDLAGTALREPPAVHILEPVPIGDAVKGVL